MDEDQESRWTDLVRMVATAPLPNLKVTIMLDWLEGSSGLWSGVVESKPI